MTKKPRATLSGRPPEQQEAGAPAPIDPRTGMHRDYWVLPEEERAKGFVRPLRRTYRHVGRVPPTNLRDLTPEEQDILGGWGYVKFEVYPETELPKTGRFWTQAQLDALGGCGKGTIMAQTLAETFARDPSYYGATFCATCQHHLPVEEFVWDGTDERVGS